MKGQKSIIRTLTNRSFKANKTRNLIAVFAIVLTTVMFTSLFVLSQSMVENMRNMNFQQAGYNSHLSSSTMTDADMEKIVSHEAVRDYGKSTIIGVAENKELTGRQVEIRYADENYARSSFSYPTTGTMPVIPQREPCRYRKTRLLWIPLPLIRWDCPMNWDRKSPLNGART